MSHIDIFSFSRHNQKNNVCAVRLDCQNRSNFRLKKIGNNSTMIKPSGSGLRTIRFALIAVVATGVALIPIAVEPLINTDKYSECCWSELSNFSPINLHSITSKILCTQKRYKRRREKMSIKRKSNREVSHRVPS